MLDKPNVFLAGAVLLAPILIANQSAATDPPQNDSTICSIVVSATVTLLRPFDGAFFKEHHKRLIAACAESVAGYRCGATPGHRPYPFFDVSQLSDDETVALLREPSKMAVWLRHKGMRRLGDLPLRLVEAQARLIDALVANDPSESVDRAAVVIALATQASLPFGTASPQSVLLAKALRVDVEEKDDPCDCCQTLRDRLESELVRRNVARVRFEVRPYRGRLQGSADRGGNMLREMLLAHAALRDLVKIERDVCRELEISTPRHLVQKQGAYFDRLGARCLAVVEARLEGGAVLASRLLLDAWTSAGMDERGFGAYSSGSRANEGARNARSGDEDESRDHLVGSAHSSVVHKSTCPHVKRIHQRNRVRFKSLAEAVKAGRKPCRQCKPE